LEFFNQTPLVSHSLTKPLFFSFALRAEGVGGDPGFAGRNSVHVDGTVEEFFLDFALLVGRGATKENGENEEPDRSEKKKQMPTNGTREQIFLSFSLQHQSY
jgi:hypothetical protein